MFLWIQKNTYLCYIIKEIEKMTNSKHNPTQKYRSIKRTKKINDIFEKIDRGLLSVVTVPNTKGRVLTILDPNNDCFHSKGKYLYIGVPYSQLKKYFGNAAPKLGKAELPVGETISAPKNRYSKKDPFVVINVITVDNELLVKHGVETVRQLEEKIRKENNFTPDCNFDGKEYWKGVGVSELIKLVNDYLFDGKQKETYEPRIPQKRAINKMINAFANEYNKEFLLGAIMSFGKNFTFLYAITEILKNKTNARILVWTNKPGVFKSFVEDVNGHVKFSNYTHISMKDSKDVQVLPNKCVVTASRQLLENCKNSDVLNFIENQEWDFIVIDECHHGIETETSQKFLNRFKNIRKIYVSGTPQKQLGKIQFNSTNTFIYDEVSQKEDKESGIWVDAIILKTQLIKLTPQSVSEYKSCIDDISGYFTFTKFFSNNKNGLIYQASIIKFFKDFFGFNKFDQSLNFFGKHNHIAILVPSNIEGTTMLSEILRDSEIGKDYEIVAATGKKFKRSQLTNALSSGKKTITLLSDMLIEGETVPEWDCAINMSDGTSIFKYLQFAFRPTRPSKKIPNKEGFFYDLNPQRHFLIQEERMRSNGFKGKDKDDNLRKWYKNFNIMIGESVEDMVDVNFETLKKESYVLNNMMRSINSLMFWDSVDLTQMSIDLDGVVKQNSVNEKINFNDNNINGGKNNRKEVNSIIEPVMSEKEFQDIKEKWVTIMSRVPYVLKVEGCKTLDDLLNEYRNFNGLFEGAFGIPQVIFEKYWGNSNFTDKYEMDFYFNNFVESI